MIVNPDCFAQNATSKIGHKELGMEDKPEIFYDSFGRTKRKG